MGAAWRARARARDGLCTAAVSPTRKGWEAAALLDLRLKRGGADRDGGENARLR